MSVDLVTGATGFIGGHLARRLLAQGRAVRVVCRPASVPKLDPATRARAEVVEGDLLDAEAARRAVRGAGRVFHCAGHVSDWGADAEFVAGNVTAAERVLDAASEERVGRVVHLSSIAVFGLPPPPRFDDESPYGTGADPYSRTKIAGERAALRAHAERGLPVAVLRPAVVYGAGSAWVEEPLAMIRAGRMFLLGGGKGTCHPCYVENLVDAMLLAAEHPRAVGRAYIVTDGVELTFAEYFDRLAGIAGRGPIRRSIPLPVARAMATALEAAARLRGSRTRPLLTHAAIEHVTARSHASIRRIREELGYAPRHDVASAMAELARALAPGRPPGDHAPAAP